MNAKVSIVKCQDYEQKHVDEAVRQSFDLLGGLQNIIKPKDKVLLKVNALMGIDPEAAVTTHPSLVTAVIREVKKLGAQAFVGDSPGNASANVRQTMENTGFTKAVEQAGGEIFYFQETGITEVPSPSKNKRIKILKIAKAVLEADAVINLPKLKTHNFTLYTGAIKNMFGSVPGFHKSKYHIMAPRPSQFAQSIVDILEITKPKLNIMDAVYGMEGHGPTGGKKRFMGAVTASFDAVAMDAVGAAAIGYKPFEIDTTRVAHQRGLGEGRLEKIEVIGTPLAEIQQEDWEHSTDVHRLTRFIPEWLYSLVRPIARFARIDPVIIQETCTKCLICVKNCPAQCMFFRNNQVKINLNKCIMCFCCHELCPHKAIKLRRSWLSRKLGIGGAGYDE